MGAVALRPRRSLPPAAHASLPPSARARHSITPDVVAHTPAAGGGGGGGGGRGGEGRREGEEGDPPGEARGRWDPLPSPPPPLSHSSSSRSGVAGGEEENVALRREGLGASSTSRTRLEEGDVLRLPKRRRRRVGRPASGASPPASRQPASRGRGSGGGAAMAVAAAAAAGRFPRPPRPSLPVPTSQTVT